MYPVDYIRHVLSLSIEIGLSCDGDGIASDRRNGHVPIWKTLNVVLKYMVFIESIHTLKYGLADDTIKIGKCYTGEGGYSRSESTDRGSGNDIREDRSRPHRYGPGRDGDNKRTMDITHYYVEKGQGKPLVLLHGNGESSEFFVNQIDVFAEQYRVIAVDTRGHGRTPRGHAPFTIQQFSRDLSEFFKRLGLEKADVLGFSDGGNIALQFAIDYPDKVGKLILNSANLDPSGLVRSLEVALREEYVRLISSGKKDPETERQKELLLLMLDDPHIPAEKLMSVKSKTLVIVGDRDLIKRTHSRLIAKMIPDSEFVVMRGDHSLAAKHPDEFNREVLRFLEEP